MQQRTPQASGPAVFAQTATPATTSKLSRQAVPKPNTPTSPTAAAPFSGAPVASGEPPDPLPLDPTGVSFAQLFHQALRRAARQPLVIVGNFKASSPHWGYDYGKTQGRQLRDIISSLSLTLLTDPAHPTRFGEALGLPVPACVSPGKRSLVSTYMYPGVFPYALANEPELKSLPGEIDAKLKPASLLPLEPTWGDRLKLKPASLPSEVAATLASALLDLPR
ncbi:hypothetical protein HPB51_001017 [Rhipicephalus microplus]|uniref:Uncharacterized protein n=1 Tax=Rhipicephalus microplus TaxID=6941 RepID=A0A9J6DE79_RHIMP|nr:hypothetical protein HPB51_001017 [Rhipicephalus microplus]